MEIKIDKIPYGDLPIYTTNPETETFIWINDSEIQKCSSSWLRVRVPLYQTLNEKMAQERMERAGCNFMIMIFNKVDGLKGAVGFKNENI